MFDALKGMAQSFLGGSMDPHDLAQAARDHLASLDGDTIGDHLETAASNSQAQGQNDLADQLVNLASQARENPSAAIGALTSFIQNNPQVLQHFAPELTQGILARLGASAS